MAAGMRWQFWTETQISQMKILWIPWGIVKHREDLE